MSNNYFAFSTAPGGHALSVPATGMLGHPSSGNSNASNNNGVVPQLGAGSTGSLMSGGGSGGGGAGMMLYPPLPPSQQQQQHLQHTSHASRLNPGAPMIPAPFHAAPVTVSANAGGSGTAIAGGPAVPPPRSTAALIAEATGAPPPPPRSSLTGNSCFAVPAGAPGAASPLTGGVAAPSGSTNSQSMTMTTPPASATGISTPMGGLAGAGIAATPLSPTTNDATNSLCTAFESPSFTAFTTSAATMLSAQGSFTTGSDGAPGATAVNVGAGAAGAAAAAAMGGAASTIADLTGKGQGASVLSPFSHVEVQATLSSRERGDAGGAETGATTWDPTEDQPELLDDLAHMFACLTFDDEEMTMEMQLNMDEGDREAFTLFSFNDLRKSAAVMHARILESKISDSAMRQTLRVLAMAIICKSHYNALLLLPPREIAMLRYTIVHYLLTWLVKGYMTTSNVDICSKGFAMMMGCRLVSVTSFATMVDTFLQREEMVPMALRLLAVGLDNVDSQRGLCAALANVPRIAQRLQEIYTHNHELEVDVALLTRYWAHSGCTLSAPLLMPISAERGSCPVTCMSYFGVRDELITGHMNGSVVLWGAPQTVREKSRTGLFPVSRPVIRARGVVPLPLDCVPVGMAGQRIDGQYLAIASMPYKSRRPYSDFCKEAGGAPGVQRGIGEAESGGGEQGNGAGVGAIIVITCNENSIRWNKGEVIMRPAGVALTAITAFRNSIVVVGESLVKAKPMHTDKIAAAEEAILPSPATSSLHRLSFVDVAYGTVMRQIPNAHDDYITALTVLDEGSYVLLSGGRDSAVKLWDPRSREDSPVVNTALCAGVASHNTTISAICTTGFNVLSTSVDGSMRLWDLRSMDAPVVQHDLAYHTVDVSLISNRRAAAATSRGLVIVSLDTLRPTDMCYAEPGYTHVTPNSSGELVFAASCSGSLSAAAVLES